MLLCVDSDFDFLFNGATEQSRLIRDSRYMFHTYTYATENYLCYAPSLHNVCVKATKNDTRIFDFERFMADYSRTIYRLFSGMPIRRSCRTSMCSLLSISSLR